MNKLYALIHPFGGNMDNLDKMRSIISTIREKHPEIVVISPLDTVFYEDRHLAHSQINVICGAIVSRCDGIIVPDNWEDSAGCREEIRVANEHGKEILCIKDLL